MINKEIKIFLTADLHIGMLFNRYPEFIKEDLRNARIKTLDRMVRTANHLECNIFVIAGDLFDKVNGISQKMINEVLDALNYFTGQCILVLPGNHDYDNGMIDLWTKFTNNMLDNLILLNEEKPYLLDEYGIDATVYPAPCHAKHSKENNLAWIREEKFDESRIIIGIGHGAITDISPDLKNEYYSMTLQELNDIPVDLWLLGHTHLPYPQQENTNDIKVFNPGTHEPDGLDCKHKGNAWIINVDIDKNVSANRLITGTYKFIDKVFEVKDQDDLDNMYNEVLMDNPDMTIARITLVGRIDEETRDYCNSVIEKLNKELAYLMTDFNDLGIKVSTEKIHKEFSEKSFPQEFLLSFADDEDTLQLAYELIMEVREW